MTKREQRDTDTDTGSHWPEHFQCKRSPSDESSGCSFQARRSGTKTIPVDDAFVQLMGASSLFGSPRFFLVSSI
jgi:hypothetical protein